MWNRWLVAASTPGKNLDASGAHGWSAIRTAAHRRVLAGPRG